MFAAQTHLSDFIVVCKEHGQVLGLLDGGGFGHLSEKLSRPKQKQNNKTSVLFVFSQKNEKNKISICSINVSL